MPTEEELEEKNRIQIKEKICVEHQPILIKILEISYYWLSGLKIIEVNDTKFGGFQCSSDEVSVKVLNKKIIGIALRIGYGKSSELSDEHIFLLFDLLKQLRTLVELKIDSIRILSIPESIENLDKLQSLSILRCNVRNIPENLCNLVQLKRLILAVNSLLELPENIGRLKNLEYLDVSTNEYLQDFPDTIAQLTKLKVLRLDDLKKITKLPQSILMLENLEELTAGIELTELPQNINYLSSLKKLDVSSNKILILPDSIGNLFLLEELNLGNNLLTELPDTIGNLKSLKSLHLHDNNLLKLPDTIVELTNLESLGLASNQIEKLPGEFGKLQKLDFLDISDNPISKVPNSFVKLPQLSYFNIEKTNIQELPREDQHIQVSAHLDHICQNCNSQTLGVTKYCSKCGHETGISEKILKAYCCSYIICNSEKDYALYYSLDQNQRDGFTVIEHMAKTNEEYFNSYRVNWLEKDGEIDMAENINVNVEDGKVLTLDINRIWNFNTELFNEALWHFKSLKHLFLVNMEIEFIPENIGKLRDLETLELNFLIDELDTIPEFLRNNQNLKNLTIIAHSIESIPEWFVELVNLEKLHLSNASFRWFPKQILKLPKLRNLSLIINGMFSIPKEIQKLHNLRRLYIRGDLIFGAENLKGLPNIEQLTLLGVNEVPEWLESLELKHKTIEKSE